MEESDRKKNGNKVMEAIFPLIWIILSVWALYIFFNRRNPCKKGFLPFFRNLLGLFFAQFTPPFYILYGYLTDNPAKCN